MLYICCTVLYYKAMTTTTGKPYSEKQANLIGKLTDEREVPVAGKDVQEAVLIARHEDVLGGGKFVSMREASDVITWLFTLPKKETLKPSAAAKTPLTPGFYVEPASNEIVKVKPTKDKKRLYAMAMVGIHGERLTTGGEIVNWDWKYAPGLVNHIDPSWKMSADLAAELGIRTGRCISCKRPLKAAKSVQAMIGPVCIKYFA